MSSTNRSAARESHISDYYVTPLDAVEEFFQAFLQDYFFDAETLGNLSVLDPCAGGDENHPMSYPTVLHAYGINYLTTIDVREDSRASIIADYLQMPSLGCKPDMIITNPPFSLAEPIIKRALQDVNKKNGFVIMLLRLNFLGGLRRKREFWDEVGLPTNIYVHPRRMCFTNNGKTDSIEYAHFVWHTQKGSVSSSSCLRLI